MISVIIPAYNEERGIVKAINSILPQISKEDEIIVISSGSTDGTEAEVQKIADERVRLIIQKERKGKASAINLALKKAKGDIIVQTDSDVELKEDALHHLINPFNDSEVVGVSGHPVPIIPKDNLFYDWTVMSYNKMDELRAKQYVDGTFWHMSGYLLAFRKETMFGREIPFAKGAVDAVMSQMIKGAGEVYGGDIAYAPNALVYVKAPTTIKDFIAQKARVRAGYAALPNAPRTAGSEVGSFIPEMFKIKIWRWSAFIACGFIYAWCWIKGKLIKDRPLQEIWKIPESTK
jgi:glycosyltransferase involved in cell wall biosynthesis